jgi:hypothetical protein
LPQAEELREVSAGVWGSLSKSVSGSASRNQRKLAELSGSISGTANFLATKLLKQHRQKVQIRELAVNGLTKKDSGLAISERRRN